MADHTKIEWTDATWNIITGCSVVSPGCTNCYAMRLAGTRLRNIPSRVGLTRDSKAGPVWNGEIRFNEEWLDQPLRWRRPRMIFVCAHGDLFAEGVTDAMLDKVFAVMALAPQHTFQVLTKRPERMRDYMGRSLGRIADTIIRFRRDRGDADMVLVPLAHITPGHAWWPLPNVWLGVSVEDQKRADERIPVLLDTPAAVRWISAEPLLGPVDLTSIDTGSGWVDSLQSYIRYPMPSDGHFRNEPIDWPHLDWIVAGGESGPGARPMHPEWARSIRDQCAAAGVPFLFKQWGGWLHESHDANGEWDWSDAEDRGILHYWRDDPEMGTTSMPLPKKATGRLLDGVTHDAFPQVRP
ncbi:phage Gp37/Gp68 family protein [Aurantimonas sp. A2-1-M11]|uniref:DUF5131 family protein n=1 Tax=Aurantimonas sp. A2-1-M11 TaxID=3113712 RepID=UPI002F95F61E